MCFVNITYSLMSNKCYVFTLISNFFPSTIYLHKSCYKYGGSKIKTSSQHQYSSEILNNERTGHVWLTGLVMTEEPRIHTATLRMLDSHSFVQHRRQTLVKVRIVHSRPRNSGDMQWQKRRAEDSFWHQLQRVERVKVTAQTILVF